MILLLGSTGQIGFELKRFLICLGEIRAPSRSDLNILDKDELRNYITVLKPKWIVNAIAYTNVEMAEKEGINAYALNAEFTKNLAIISQEIDAKLIHLSTDYVFDGKLNSPYSEKTLPNPINVYGKSKLMGEENIIKYCSKHIIIRTSWVYGLYKENFVLKMLSYMKENKPINVVYDQIGTPTWSRHIAQGITHIMIFINLREKFSLDPSLWGIYNLTSKGKTNWYEFTKEIYLLSGIKYNKKIKKIKSTDFNSLVSRPKYSVLSNDKIDKIFGIRIPEWNISLRDCLIDKS